MDRAFAWILVEFLQGALEIGRNIANLFFCIPCIESGGLFDIGKKGSLFLHQFHKIVSEMFPC